MEQLIQTLSKWLLRLLGWQVLDLSGNTPRFLMAVAPHTSNWDFIYALIVRYAAGYGFITHFLGKSELFKPPFGFIFKAAGGIPVERKQRGGQMVAQAVALYQGRERFGLAIAPEGTRKKSDAWKSGFYYIALEAQVPILPIVIDYRERRITIHPPFFPTGHYNDDLQALGRYFQAEQAKYPEMFTPPLGDR
jgi:1-acyl-sn-glycerol-3-phosphate acyltransferase